MKELKERNEGETGRKKKKRAPASSNGNSDTSPAAPLQDVPVLMPHAGAARQAAQEPEEGWSHDVLSHDERTH